MLDRFPPHWIGFLSLVHREVARFMAYKSMTVFPPILTTILYIVVFGFSLGGRIQEIHTFSYIEFIIPGLVLMSVIMSAFNHSSGSIFMSKYDYSIQDVLLSPLSYFQMVMAFTLGGIIRGVLVGLLVLASGFILAHLTPHSISFTLLFLILTAQIFSSFGIWVGLWSERWDQQAFFMNFFLMPMIFLGGVFYAVNMLPPVWQFVNHLNPVYYMVSGIRYGMLNFQEVSPWTSLWIVLLSGFTLMSITIVLFRMGYKLKS